MPSWKPFSQNMRKLRPMGKPSKTGKTTRGKLIKGMTGSLPARLFENPFFDRALKTVLKDSPGIYALYKDGGLYYVGLSKNLNGRIKHHLDDRHRNKWDTFKIFKIKNVNYLKDLETLILQIAPPGGNRQIGRLPKKQRRKLTQPFKSALEHMRQEVDVIYKALRVR